MKKSRGVTLVETLTIIFILAIIMETISTIFVSGWKYYHRESALIQTQDNAKFVISSLTKEIIQSSSVLGNRNFSGTTYTSGSNELIIKTPSIDNDKNPIENTFDYIVFYLEPTDSHILKEEIEANAASSRTNQTKTVSTMINNISFTYLTPDTPENATAVTVSITSAQGGGGEVQTTTLVSAAKLRNK